MLQCVSVCVAHGMQPHQHVVSHIIIIYCAPVYSTTMNIRCVCVHKKVLEHSGPFSPGVHYLMPHMHNDSMVSNLNNLHRPICCYETAVLCMSCSNDSLIQVNCAG